MNGSQLNGKASGRHALSPRERGLWSHPTRPSHPGARGQSGAPCDRLVSFGAQRKTKPSAVGRTGRVRQSSSLQETLKSIRLKLGSRFVRSRGGSRRSVINRSRGRDGTARNGTARSTASRSGRSTAARGGATTTAAVTATAVATTRTLLAALLLAAAAAVATARLSGAAGALGSAARRGNRSTARRGGRGAAARSRATATTLTTAAATSESFAAHHTEGCHNGNQQQKFTTH